MKEYAKRLGVNIELESLGKKRMKTNKNQINESQNVLMSVKLFLWFMFNSIRDFKLLKVTKTPRWKHYDQHSKN